MIYNYSRNRLKSIISGKINITKYNKEFEIDNLKKKFLNFDFEIKDEKLRTFSFCKKKNIKKTLITKLQKIFAIDRNKFFPTLLDEIYIMFASAKYKRKICLPLNNELIKKINKKNNFNFSNINCNILWYFLLFYYFLTGIKNFFKIIYLNIKNIFEKKNFQDSIFFDLNTNYEVLFNNENNFHIIHQYINKNNTAKNIYTKPLSDISKKNLYYKKIFNKNNINFFYVESPIPLFEKASIIFLFSIWFFYSLWLVIFDFFKGNHYSIMLFDEIINSKAFSYASKNNMMDEYIFSYQGIGHRPLWTYDAEDNKKKISLFFYSTNSEPYTVNSIKPSKNTSNWENLSYNNFYVWNNFQKEIILKNIINRKLSIEILGPILIHINKKYKLPFNKFIAAFDITPERMSKKLFLTKDIINGYFLNKFYNDILKLSILKKLPLVIRTKKNYFDKYNYDKNYILCLQNIQKYKHVKIINRESSSLDSIIKESLCCISYPFTSTAIVANELRKPSIYYDPTKLISNLNNHIDHGIKTLNDFDSLKKWVENQKLLL